MLRNGSALLPSIAVRMRPALFLDRDGIINRCDVIDGRPYAPVRYEDFEILSGVVETVGHVKSAGFPVIVVTNQPDLSTGKQDLATLDRMHDYVRSFVGVDDVLVCPHVDAEGCDCRKPKPGMLLAAAEKHGLDLAGSVMVGDRWRDVEAGRAVGCSTIFVDYDYSEARPESPDLVVGSLSEAETFILRTLEAKYLSMNGDQHV
jgi:D-glycero-D-manno-heptose 1,7-bisphosphate phosphatase